MKGISTQRRRLVLAHRPIGAALVEFALVLPVFLLVVFGAVNFGALMYDQSVISHAAREGARWASIKAGVGAASGCTNTFSATPIDPCQVAYSYAVNRLIAFSGALSPVATFTASQGYDTGAPQSVTVTYFYTGIGWFFGHQNPSTYSATSVMLHE